MVTLQERTLIHAPIERCFDLARSVEAHLAGNVHWGEEAAAEAGITSGLVGVGQRVTWRATHFGVRFRLTSEIVALERPAHFRDVMIHGPFRSMQHDHFFQALSPNRTEMRDAFCFAAPVPLLGRFVEMVVLRGYMQRLLRERSTVLQRIAESGEWRCYLPIGI